MNIQYRPEGLPEAHGLYDPRNEHDACGIGLIANIHNVKSHRMVADGLSILKNLEHRGAVGADPKAGDGAGLMLQIPHAFFADYRDSYREKAAKDAFGRMIAFLRAQGVG